MVEAGGQSFRSFRCGLDYAFILARLRQVRMRSVLSGSLLQPDPSAHSVTARSHSESMSLYRAGLKLAFFLPLGVAMRLIAAKVSPM